MPIDPTRREMLLGMAAAGAVGCGEPTIDRLPPGIHEVEDRIRGINRRAWLIVPEGLSVLAPMVVGLHDNGQKPSDLFDRCGWRKTCAERGWVGVFPAYPKGDLKDDNSFVAHLIMRAAALAGTDNTRTYLFGHGAGGRRAYAFGSVNAKWVTAIGASAAVVRFSENGLGLQDPAEPLVSVIHVHGGKDTVVPVAGGSTEGADHKKRVIAPLDDGLRPWIDAIGGASAPMTLQLPERVNAARWTGHGREVVRIVDPDMERGWNTDFGTRVMADFFAAAPPQSDPTALR